MYITSCRKCGKVEIVSSIADKYGITQACWTCPKCGAGQLLQITSAGIKRGSDLRRIVKGIGFITNGKFAENHTHKTPWLD